MIPSVRWRIDTADLKHDWPSAAVQDGNVNQVVLERLEVDVHGHLIHSFSAAQEQMGALAAVGIANKRLDSIEALRQRQ